MKRIYHLLAASLLLLAAALFFLPWKTDANRPAPMPAASVPGGYYDTPFVLELSAAEGAAIYYTTDGSLPTASSIPYTGGIAITDRSHLPNQYRSIPNIVPNWLDYTPDETPVEKGTVIRAVSVLPDGRCSAVLTQTYFVGIAQPDGPSVCLTFQPEQMFGDDGIYVTGKAYDAWYISGGEGTPPTCNFDLDQEIAGNLELLSPQGSLLNQPVGIRIQGASSRENALKNLALTARPEYGGSKLFDKPLFDGTATHSVMLKASISDALVHDLVSDRNVATQNSQRVRLYLNGEYWFDTVMLERYDRQYFRQHYGVDERVLIKNGSTDADSKAAGRGSLYQEFMAWVQETDFSDPEEYAALQQEMDVQSYIDYIAINYYLCNWDVSERKNYVLWRSPDPDGPGFGDGRWRWCLYDQDILDVSQHDEQTPFPAAVNTFTTNFSKSRPPLGQSSLLTALRRSPDFNRQFVLSFMDIVNQNMQPARVETLLEAFGLDISWNSAFFAERPRYAAEHLSQEFQLTGTLETLTVSIANPEGGRVQVNTTVIDLSDGQWSGQYFTDYPITLTAIPADGYQFTGWKGDVNETASAITVPLDGGLAVEPVFAKTT